MRDVDSLPPSKPDVRVAGNVHARIRRRANLLVALLAASGCGCGTDPPDPATVAADAHLQAFVRSHGVPGATAAFVLPDGRSAAVASGVADSCTGRPMRPTDRMFAGSIGKTFVAALALELAAEGWLELDAPVDDCLGREPWFPRLPNAPDLTLRVLLNHTSGMPEHNQVPAFLDAVAADPYRQWRPEELVAYVLDRPPLFAVGKGWSYADTNYIVVGMAVERATGREVFALIRERFLEPLSLDATEPADRPDLAGLACGHTTVDNPFRLPQQVVSQGRYAMNPQLEWTGGGLITTSLDLARWADALYGGEVLSPEALAAMRQGVPSSLGPDLRYGLGVILWPSPLGPACGHSGWVPGYVSMTAYYPERRVAVAVQLSSDVGRSSAELRSFLDELAVSLVP
jgi:D-alanyl-D-alanine carboxypeptidase